MRTGATAALALAAALLCWCAGARAGDLSAAKINPKNAKKSGLSAAQKSFIVDYHNEFRRNVSAGLMRKAGGGYMPTAMDMFEMKWDSKLASSAQNYANKCNWGHDPTNDDYGENLATNTYNSLRPMIDMWITEVTDHRLSSIKKFDKKDLKKLGHATAMMWWKTDRVGCGLRRGCTFNFYGKKWTMNFLVCRYSPVGNIYNRRIYAKGRTCAHCSKYDRKCDKGLCVEE